MRVFISDDDPIVRAYLVHLASLDPHCEVVGSASTSDETIRGIDEHSPEVLLLDIHFLDGSGFEVLKALQSRDPRPRVLVLTGDPSGETLRRALQLGAQGFLAKDEAIHRLHEAVRAVADGRIWISDKATECLALMVPRLGGTAESAGQEEGRSLTRRETEVAQLVARGLSNRQIAVELDLSEATVKSHITRALEKLGLQNRTQLALQMNSNGDRREG